MADDFLAQCQQLANINKASRPDFISSCLCVIGGRKDLCASGADTDIDTAGGGSQAHLQSTRLTAADQLSADVANTTDATTVEPPADRDRPDDNLINSDVFIYVIVFIVIVYFLTFLYLCMKKRQREAEDAEAGGGGGRSGDRALVDRPPTYDEVVLQAHGSDGKSVEPPTYAEVLARSQQLDKLDELPSQQQEPPPPPTPDS